MLSSDFVGLLSSRNSTIVKKQEGKSDNVINFAFSYVKIILKDYKRLLKNKVVDLNQKESQKVHCHFQIFSS